MSGYGVPSVKVERLNPELDYIKAIRVADSQIKQEKPPLPMGYRVDRSFGHDGFYNGRTGVQVVALEDTETGARVIAVAGSNQFNMRNSSNDVNDWPTTGRKQWKEVKPLVENYITSQPVGTHIEMTGYSIGGAVVQHGLHDLKNPDGNLADRDIHITTFDSPGVASTVEGYDPARVGVDDAQHIVVKDSIVNKVADKHLGGNVAGIEGKYPFNPDDFYSPIKGVGGVIDTVRNHDLESIERTIQDYAIMNRQLEPYDPHPANYPGAFPAERTNLPTSSNEQANSQLISSKSSLLDYFNKGVGKIGSAIGTVGHIAFDTAVGLGKETLTQTIRLALTQGGSNGKALLKQTAQMVVGNMLAGMHAQVIQRGIEQAGWPTGIAGPLQHPTKPVEQAMNDLRNQTVFERMASEVQRLLGIYPDLDPSILMADQGLKHIRQGDIKIPQGVLLPDMLPVDKPKGDEPRIDILGRQLPIGWPQIGVIHENPDAALPPSQSITFNDLFAFRDGEGVVQVASYSRGGITVKAHSRSKPDEDVTNNLSYRVKRT